MQFPKECLIIKIDDNEILDNFDVLSSFTAIPVFKVCDYIKKNLEQNASLPSRANLDIEDIISLLQFTLSNECFVVNVRIYKQVHGCVMGSPVSPVVATISPRKGSKLGIHAIGISSVPAKKL